MAITTEYRQQNEVLVIKTGEKFDFSKVEDFRSAYGSVNPDTRHIAVDLSNTEYMDIALDFSRVGYLDSSALGMLLNMQKSLKQNNYTYSIENARPQVAKILQISRFDKKFELR
jgi:anti-anti-sigma regulatory factor